MQQAIATAAEQHLTSAKTSPGMKLQLQQMVDKITQKPPLPEQADLQRRRKLREDIWMLWLKDPKQDQGLFWQKVEIMGLESER